MKHYCNRRTPKRNIEKNYPTPAVTSSAILDDIILPPVYECSDINSCGQGGAFSQGSGLQKEFSDKYNEAPDSTTPVNIFYDNMQGQFDLISIPQDNNGLTVRSMSTFLDRYIGKLICLDLWTRECRREEMCGTLIETGKNYIVIRVPGIEKLTVIDLRSIRYVSIYCK